MHDEPTGNPPALFDAYPRLAERVPHVSIGDWPTPVTCLPQFGAAHDMAAMYCKREDLAHTECGGNKVRGLEFVLADAKRCGTDTIVTLGAAGSNHVCNTAWHARRFGIDTVAVVVDQPPGEYVRRNILRGLDAGTRYIPANYVTLLPKLIVQLLSSRRGEQVGRSYTLPGGGTSPLACLGHVSAAMELKRQIKQGSLPAPDFLYVALGSLGTAAGLALGCKLAGLDTRIVGVVVSYRWYCTAGRWARLARRTHRLVQRLDPTMPDVRIDKSQLTVIGTALGRGYAHPTPSSAQLARELHETEGIQLDGTYTAKALDGAMSFIRQHRLEDKVHLFWQTFHTGAPSTSPHLPIEGIPPHLRRYFD